MSDRKFWRLNYKHKRFVDALIDSNWHVEEASAKVGLSRRRGYQLASEDKIIEAVKERIEDSRKTLAMEDTEVLQRVTDLARDAGHKDHFRALELLAKIHGLTTTTVNINLSRQEAIVELRQHLTRLKEEGTPALEAEEVKVLPPSRAN